MPVTEVGCMAVKPGIDIMDDSTPEGQILPKAWKAVLAAPGGPSRIYWSLASDDPLQSWAFFDFNSIEEHENFSKSYVFFGNLDRHDFQLMMDADLVEKQPKTCLRYTIHQVTRSSRTM